MTFQQEARSWLSPPSLNLSSIPDVGDTAPSTDKLKLPPTSSDTRPVLVTLLRHCGCPFAERDFISLRKVAKDRTDIRCVAVSHSDQQSTDNWLEAIGGQGDVEVVVDPERQVFASFGLGASSLYHVLNPWSLYNVYRLGKEQGIWNKPTESGNRWQRAGNFAINKDGKVAWSKPAQTADEVADFEHGIKALA